MRKFLFAAAAALAVGALMPSASQAMPLAPAGGLLPATGQTGLINEAQATFYIGRQRYCWYWDGWQGPGYYYCGYAWRRGYGWGGPAGWGGRRYSGPRPRGYSSGYRRGGGSGYRSSGSYKRSGGGSSYRSGGGGYKKSGGGYKKGGKKY